MLVALIAAAVSGDLLSLPMLAAIAIATTGVILMSLKPGAPLLHKPRPMLTGPLAGALFGPAAIGFLALPDEGFQIRATTILAHGLTVQTGVLPVWTLAFDGAPLSAPVSV